LDTKYIFIQSVGRAFSILEQFSSGERALGVTTIAKRAGLHKSTCFGLLHTLQRLGYIQHDAENGLYSLGLKAFELGQAYIGGMDLRSVTHPFLLQILEKSHETVHLVVPEGRRAVYIDKVEAPHAMTISSRIGQEASIHSTAVGKVLLAHMCEEDRAKVLSGGLQRFTQQTITDEDQLREHLQRIRECGYAIDDQEREVGLRCVAAPIFNARKQAVAAISISGTSPRITREKLDELSQIIKQSAQEISRLLGYRP
jgi:IclR family acetate operon transcriptional repressor